MNPLSLLGQLIGAIWHVLTGILQVPIGWLLVHLTLWFANFAPLQAIGGFGLAVIIVTAGIRVLLMPVFAWQMKAQVKMQEDAAKLKGPLAELRKQYGKDRTLMVAKQQELYKEHGMSPLGQMAGCLPVFVQAPVLYGLYGGIRSAVDQLPSTDLGFLWLPDVGKSGIDICCRAGGSTDYSRLFGAHWTVVILPVIAALLTVVQSKMMLPAASPNPTDQEKMQQQIGHMTTFLIPAVILITGLNFPAGLAIYWVTQSTFMVGQQYHLLGWGNMRVPTWLPGATRKTPLAIRKQAAAAGKKPETVEREYAKARKLEAAAAAAPPGTGASSGSGMADATADVSASERRTSGRAKTRSTRPQNRKRRR